MSLETHYTSLGWAEICECMYSDSNILFGGTENFWSEKLIAKTLIYFWNLRNHTPSKSQIIELINILNSSHIVILILTCDKLCSGWWDTTSFLLSASVQKHCKNARFLLPAVIATPRSNKNRCRTAGMHTLHTHALFSFKFFLSVGRNSCSIFESLLCRRTDTKLFSRFIWTNEFFCSIDNGRFIVAFIARIWRSMKF